MDNEQFDLLSKSIGSSRRTILGGILAGLLLPRDVDATDKGKRQSHKRHERQKRRKKQQSRKNDASCWRRGACIARLGSNISRCNLVGSPAFNRLDCTRCNLSGANLRGVKTPGTNFSGANFAGACLVSTDFTGATFDDSTVFGNAIFCNTKMPDGTINNSDCGAGTDCCLACIPGTCQSLGKNCGTLDDGCGGTLTCGTCSNPTPACINNVCSACTNNEQCQGQLFCCGGTCRPEAWSDVATLGGPGSFQIPQGLAMSSDGIILWIGDEANDSSIAVWSRTGANNTDWGFRSRFAGGSGNLDRPWGVAVTRDNLNVLVADAEFNRVVHWTRPNDSSSNWSVKYIFGSTGTGPAQFRNPSGVAISADGMTAWIADSGNGRISVWVRTSQFPSWRASHTFNDHLSYPYGLVVSGDGLTLWVSDFNLSNVFVFTRPSAGSTSWSIQARFGSVGNGPNEFRNPTGMAVSADALTLLVGDRENQRVSVWTRPNASSATWTPKTTFGRFGYGAGEFASVAGVAVTGDGRTALVADGRRGRVSMWRITCPE